MRLLNCCRYGGHCPPGSIYVGRGTPRQPRHPLANPFIAQSRAPRRCRTAVVVPDESVLERYRRHLTSAVVQHFAALPALRELERGAMLGCWCVERDAILVGAGRPEPDLPCHGDVIFTVWLALELLDWDVPRVSFQDDFDGANRAWAELYEHAFGERMLWGEANEAGKCSLPSSAATRGAA